jgi:hypothetical protein
MTDKLGNNLLLIEDIGLFSRFIKTPTNPTRLLKK